MKVTDIQLAGCPNALNWSIANRVELKDNDPFISVINDDSFFSVVIEGLDFYQMFRLTQLYRNQLRIRNISKVTIPSADTLEEYFPGFADKVNYQLELSTGLVTQMLADSDIIPADIPQLFLPMISVAFSVQIPFSFVDAIQVMSEEEVVELFTPEYRENLKRLPERGAAHSLIRSIMIMVERSTSNIRYDSKYDQLLQLTKYFTMKAKADRTEPFRTGLLSFGKYDAITREPVQCSMFKPTETEMIATINRLKRIKAPALFSFAVQLPIYHMQLLEARYSQDELKISHRSSINSIVDNGPCLDELRLNGSNEVIDNYRVRLADMQFVTLKTISDISLQEDRNNYHPSALFALLPPVYRTNAVISFDEDMLATFSQIDDPVLSAMFAEIIATANGIIADISG